VVGYFSSFAASGMPRFTALGEPTASVHMDKMSELTNREKAVVDLLVAGMSNQKICRALGVSERAVSKHISAICLKLGVESRLQAALVGAACQFVKYMKTHCPPDHEH